MKISRLHEQTVTWTPGPSGAPQASTVDELAGFLHSRRGLPGYALESGRSNSEGWHVLCAVYRDEGGWPVSILVLKLLRGNVELVDIATVPERRGEGLMMGMVVFMYEHGFDMRDVGAMWTGPLTADGEAMRDRGLEIAETIYPKEMPDAA